MLWDLLIMRRPSKNCKAHLRENSSLLSGTMSVQGQSRSANSSVAIAMPSTMMVLPGTLV
jgi:hypothetical protein